jgi:hypothetical protein
MIDLAENEQNKPYVVPVFPKEEVIEIPKLGDEVNLAAR